MRLLKILLTATFVVSLQHHMYAPPSSDVIFYLQPDGSIAFPDAWVKVEETNSGGSNPFSGVIDDWSIPTTEGTLTPSDSTITSGANFFTSPTEIPLDDLNFNWGGTNYGVNLSSSPDAGLVTYPGGATRGTWEVPDILDPAAALGATTVLTLGANLWSRRRAKPSVSA